MDIIWIILGFIVGLITLGVFAIFGIAFFKEWNQAVDEGEAPKVKMMTGVFIFFVFIFLLIFFGYVI